MEKPVVLKKLEAFSKEFLGVPFAHMGRNKNGMDCFGLIIAWLFVLGKSYRDHGYDFDWAKKGENHFSELDDLPDLFVRIATPLPGSVVLINGGFDVPSHAGIVLPQKKMLHALEKIGVAITPLSRYQHTIYGYYGIKGIHG
jgi:cell wall-associated NlpC family hydrolase